MKRILVAYDGSPGSEGALLDLVRAGLPKKAEAKILTIADVWLPPDLSQKEPTFPDRISASRVEARQHALQTLAAAREITKAGADRLHQLFPQWEITSQARAESPAWGILAEARRWRADLIVLGSHGRSLLERFFLGSVCQKVAAEAECSVRIFRPHHRKGDPALRILIAFDGSTDSLAAVSEVLERRWPADSHFHLVTVVDPKLTAMHHRTLSESWGDPEDHGEEVITRMVSAQVKLFQKKRFRAECHILNGDPKAIMLAHANVWKADTIFLGARGLEHGDRLYLGTFASAIATRAHCTVEIKRPQMKPQKTIAILPKSELAAT